MGLMNTLKKDFAAKKIGSLNEQYAGFSTGIDLFDYANGQRFENVDDEGNTFEDMNIGIPSGRIIMAVGASGSGKTTLLSQFANGVVLPYVDAGAGVFHNDFERATRWPRLTSVLKTRKSELEQHYILLNEDIDTETMFEQIVAISKEKIANKKDYMIDVPSPLEDGRSTKILTPTVVMIDSSSAMFTKRLIEDENLKGQSLGSQQALANSEFYKKSVAYMENANVILMIVGHITKKISMGPMDRPTATINYLKADENIPGGGAALYMSDTLLRLKPSTKLDEDKDYGIKGFKVDMTFIKSRSNSAGRVFTLIYDQTHGFDNVLTNYEFLKKNNLVKGGGRSYYLENCPDIKFTAKTFKAKWLENDELKDAMDELIFPLLEDLVPEADLDFNEDADE